eukprot:gene1913-33326_t
MASMMLRSVSGATGAFGNQRPTLCPQRLSTSMSPVTTCAYGNLPNVGGGRKWKKIETNHNGKPVKVKMHVKKGDLVQIISGADKGLVGEITEVVTKKGLVIIEGANKSVKHVGPRAEGETGQIKEFFSPFHHSNVMLYSAEKKVASRAGYKIEDGKKVRYLKKTGEIV